MKNDGAKSYISVVCFWSTGKATFLDITISDRTRYINKGIAKTYEINEREREENTINVCRK